MEKLALVVLAIGVLGVVLLLVGLYLLHLALNAHDPWTGVVAAALVFVGGRWALALAMMRG